MDKKREVVMISFSPSWCIRKNQSNDCIFVLAYTLSHFLGCVQGSLRDNKAEL